MIGSQKLYACIAVVADSASAQAVEKAPDIGQVRARGRGEFRRPRTQQRGAIGTRLEPAGFEQTRQRELDALFRGTVRQEFGEFIGTAEQYPFGFSWNVTGVGDVAFTAIAYDQVGNSATAELAVQVVRSGS